MRNNLKGIILILIPIIGIAISYALTSQQYVIVLFILLLSLYLVLISYSRKMVAILIIISVPLNWIAIQIGNVYISLFDATIILGLLYLVMAILTNKERLHFGKLEALLVVFIAISALSITVAIDKAESLSMLLNILKGFSAFMIITSILKDTDDLRSAIKANTVAASILAIFSIIQYFFIGGTGLGHFRADSIFHNANLFANYMIFSIPLCVYLVIHYRRIKRFFTSSLLIIMITAFSITFSRGGLIGLAAGLLCFLFTIKKKRMAIITAAVILVFIIMGYFVLFPKSAVGEEWAFRIGRIKGRAADVRIELAQEAINMMKSNPFLGVGIGNFEVLGSKYGDDTTFGMISHNVYLEVGAETGIFGLLVYLLILIIFIFNLWQARQEAASDDDLYMVIAILAAFIGISVHYVFFSGFRELFWIILAFGSVLYKYSISSSSMGISEV